MYVDGWMAANIGIITANLFCQFLFWDSQIQEIKTLLHDDYKMQQSLKDFVFEDFIFKNVCSHTRKVMWKYLFNSV